MFDEKRPLKLEHKLKNLERNAGVHGRVVDLAQHLCLDTKGSAYIGAVNH